MRRSAFRPILLIVDLGLIALATLLALVLQDNLELSAASVETLLPYLALTLATAAVVLPASGLPQSIWRFSVMADYLRVLICVVAVVLAAVATAFLIDHLEGVARALPLIQGLLMAFLLIGARVAMRLRHASRQNLQSRPPVSALAAGPHETVLVVGINAVTDLFLRAVAEFAPERVKVAGIVGRSERHSGRLLQQHCILGVPDEIESIVKTLDVHNVCVDRIVVTMPFTALSPMARRALLDIERTCDMRLDFFAERIGLAEACDRSAELYEFLSGDALAPMPPDGGHALDPNLAALESVVRRSYWRRKRAVDIVITTVLIVLMAPLILLLGLIVAYDVGLPTVFWQQRPGLRGRPFKLYKFRTMRSAHDRNGARVPDAQRLTPIGRFLRRTHLDELPQLYNILIGDMAIVGPRPLLPIDRASEYTARLLVAPGLTGWAQVNGASDIPARDKAALDIWYLRHATLRLDLSVMARTLLTILRGERTRTKAVQRARDEFADNPAFALRHASQRAANGADELALTDATVEAEPIGLVMAKAGT